MDKNYEDGEVIDIDEDGNLILWDNENKQPYNCGENLEEFGFMNLRPEEVSRIMPKVLFTMATALQFIAYTASQAYGDRGPEMVVKEMMNCAKNAVKHAGLTPWSHQPNFTFIPDYL